MKLIFEYQDEQISGHVKDIIDSQDRSDNRHRKSCNKEGSSISSKSSSGNGSSSDRCGGSITDLIDKSLVRESLPIPDLSEATVVRHYTNLSRLNYGIDVGLYPLGSCTMKYNPRSNEDISSLEGFKDLHPYSDIDSMQGSLRIMWELEQYLIELTGMESFSLQPSAGAQAELLGLMIAKAFFADCHESKRSAVIIPDSAHGSNPASASMLNYDTLSIPTNNRGNMDFKRFNEVLDDSVAVVMLTNPNTLGLYEEDIMQISDAARTNGSLMYCDGANMNALLGITRPAEQGFDMIHLNLHKTFSAPHGGGGPGAGVLGVRSFLSDYLPVPRIVRKYNVSGLVNLQSTSTNNADSKATTVTLNDGQSFGGTSGHRNEVELRSPARGELEELGDEDTDNENEFVLDYTKRKSVGRIKCFYGNFGTILRAYSYLRSWGSNITKVSEGAILNANYLMSLLKDVYEIPFNRPCAHEFVLTSKKFGNKSALAIAKRLLDYGYHPPTMYFPLIVREALMIEPTETESKQTLDEFATALTRIANELETDPDVVWGAPHTKHIGRLDEVSAARKPNLKWNPSTQADYSPCERID
jgi:glycine dehydrogenase subunit 2